MSNTQFKFYFVGVKTGKDLNNLKKLLSCAKGYYVLSRTRIWRLSDDTHFYENRRRGRPILHKRIIQYTKAKTKAHMARWGCELAVGRDASSLSLSSLCGYGGRGPVQNSVMIRLLSSHLVYIHHPPFPLLCPSPPPSSAVLFSTFFLFKWHGTARHG